MLGGTNPTNAAPPNSPITNKPNNLTGMLKGLPLAPSVGAAPPNRPNLTAMANSLPKGYVDDLDYLNKPLPTKARPTGPMPPDFTKDMPPTRTTSTPIPATGPQYMKKGGKVKSSSAKSKVSTASSRGDGIAQRGKTKGRMV